MTITVIGAGIGGLTTAIALKQKGFDVEIFEATPEFKKAGSGINLAINAMQVYKRLGIYDDILQAGSYTNSMIIADKNLKPLSKIDLIKFEERFDVRSVAIHRATLHKILLKHFSDIPIHLNKKLSSLSQSSIKINLSFEDGTTHTSTIVIGADGIHSAVRQAIFDNTKIRIAKQICWRGIAKINIPQKYKTELNELWGKGKRFGFVHINQDEIYWYALANYKNNYKKEFKNMELNTFFTDFHPLIGKIISSTAKNNIITNEMADLELLPTWYFKNVCLLGDSAHATTPNLGQGACQAIESAYVLSNCLSQEKEVETAFKNFETIRKKKAVKVVDTSWKIGKIAHLENTIGISLRNFVMKITPGAIAQKQTSHLFELNY